MPALVTQHFFKQNITGGAFETLAAAANSQLAIPNFIQGTNADMLTAWGSNSANACDFDIRSPSLHDNTRGMRMAYAFQPTVGAGDKVQILLPDYITQPLYPSDTLVVEVNGTATNNVGIAYTAYYDQLPGAVQRLISPGELYARFKNYVGIRVSVTAGAAGDFGTARLLNADDDRLIANTDYAWVGLTGQIPACTVVMIGPETSGRPVGCPVHWDANVSGDYFLTLSNLANKACIPVINSNNKGNIQFLAASPAGATAVAMEVMLVELGQPPEAYTAVVDLGRPPTYEGADGTVRLVRISINSAFPGNSQTDPWYETQEGSYWRVRYVSLYGEASGGTMGTLVITFQALYSGNTPANYWPPDGGLVAAADPNITLNQSFLFTWNTEVSDNYSNVDEDFQRVWVGGLPLMYLPGGVLFTFKMSRAGGYDGGALLHNGHMQIEQFQPGPTGDANLSPVYLLPATV